MCRRSLADSLETALKLAEGRVLVDIMDKEELLFSSNLACPECGFSVEELAPRMFSFNSPFGACPDCDGLGAKMIVDPDLLVPIRASRLKREPLMPGQAVPPIIIRSF